MSGGLNPDHTSDVPISQSSKCKHGVYHVGKEGEPNQACSVCRSTPKKELTPEELRALKKQNSFWE
jgi:hypothetical protein